MVRFMSNLDKIRLKKYKQAIEEANRFIERANEAVHAIETDVYKQPSKNASAKRQSMELSNALVAVRRSDYRDYDEYIEKLNGE